jgi:uncharacterized protein (DUF433 family)
MSVTIPPSISAGALPLPHPTPREHIVATAGVCGGKPRLAGHRIKVSAIAIAHERMRQSPDEIVQNHPGLTLAEVYAALSYYWDYRQEIDAEIEAARQASEKLRQNYPTKISLAGNVDGADDSISS